MLRKAASQAYRALVVATFGASLLLGQTATALAAGLTIDPAGATYTHRCDGGGVLMNVQVVTGDEAPPPGENLFVSLDADVLTGEAAVPDPMPATILVALSPHTPPPGGGYETLAGAHTIHLRMGGANADASIVIPPDFCASPATPPPSSPGKPTPGIEDSATNSSNPLLSMPASHVRARAPAPLRIAPPAMNWPFALGNNTSYCQLAHPSSSDFDECLQQIRAGKLQIVFGWFPCEASTCAKQISRFEVYKIPRRSKFDEVYSSSAIGYNTPTATPDVPIPTLEAPLPSGAVLIDAGSIGAVPNGTRLATFVSDFRTGDCFAVRVQSLQGYFSGLGRAECVDNYTKTGMIEYDIPAKRVSDLTPLIHPDPRKFAPDVLLSFDMPAVFIWSAHLVADGNAGCVSSLSRTRWDWFKHYPLAPADYQTLEFVNRSGDALDDDIKAWARNPDLSIRLGGACVDGLRNFRVHVVAPNH